ncbi:SNAP receptor [Saccharomycopsis crataegensis]|uniref:SNAP receptor n=1 Tax=Saccharomycopsis crataegensis TaxID=43959 RepID=A0AAV5QJ63_9ASCO|nr:SNAP receptor [Saccharomycopsis crataegensis]
MSFVNYDVEAQKPDATHRSSSVIMDLSKSITNFATNLTNLEKLNRQIGTKRDGIQLRQRIESALDKETDQLNTIKDKVFNLQLVSKNNASNDQEELIIGKLQKELGIITENFNSLKRKYDEKKNSASINDLIDVINDEESNNAALGEEEQEDEPSETTGLLQQQQRQQEQELINRYDMDFHQLLVQQRENNISEIQQGVEEINTIFKDINSLVLQQGVQVDTIENNLTNLANDTQNAAQELTKANNYQERKSRCSCIILVVLSVVVLVITLAIIS